ncbi:MAG: ABC transporter permease [Acidobacteria bacterium]|nr:ABC transporter permease [Acidobacteriota bacterium]
MAMTNIKSQMENGKWRRALNQDIDQKQDPKLKSRFQKSTVSDGLKRFLPFISLIALCALIPLGEYILLEKSPVFLTLGNIAAIARQTAVITIMAMGMTMVMVSGGIDLSVGSILAIASVVGSLAMRDGAPAAEGFLICLAIGAACGLLNGTAVATLKIPAFIVTLGTMGIYRGIALYLCEGNAVVGLPQGFGYLAEKNFLGFVPLPMLIVIVIALVVNFVLNNTLLGRYCYAIGSNPEAARYAGIRVIDNQVLYYTILGAMSGLAGAIETSRLVTGQPNAGEGYELNVIAAVVIGGGSLSGGQGTVTGTIIGSLIMGILANGGNLLQITPFIQKIVIGAVIIIAVTFDEFQRRQRESRQRLSKEFYIASLVICNGIVFLSGVSSPSLTTSKSVITPVIILRLCSAILIIVLLYKMWRAIQDGHARTTPGKAIGFLFIPLFGFYWLFQVTWGFARDYNRYVARHSVNAPKLSEGLFLAFAILSLVTLIPFPGRFLSIIYFFLAIVVVSKICDAVNATPEVRLAGIPNRVVT